MQEKSIVSKFATFIMSWIKFKFLALSLLVFSASSCKKLLETEPIEPSSTPVLIHEVFQTATLNLSLHFGQGYDRYANVFTQQLTTEGEIPEHIACYDLKHEYFEYDFNGMYDDVFRKLRIVIEKANEEEAFHYTGAAQVLTAVGLGKLTDAYGDIPWSEALQTEVISFPKYDPQEDIYKEIQRLLNSAITNLDTSSTASLNEGDIVYNGDIKKWKAAAYGLMARYANHLSKRYPAQSAADALAAIDKAKALGFGENWDLAYQHNGASSVNPWYEASEHAILKGARHFIEDLKLTSDPRLSSYFSPIANEEYMGNSIHCIADTISSAISILNSDSKITRSTAATPFFTYYELLFIEAETAYRSGDLNRAASAHNEAITASMNATVNTASEAIRSKIQRYCNTFASEDATTISLGKIMHEKYKAMFCRGIESWVDLRRHNFRFPGYLEIPMDANYQALGTDYIRRILYPHNQLSLNPEAIPDVYIFDRLWWDR